MKLSLAGGIKIAFDEKRLESEVIEPAFKQVADELDGAFRSAIEAPGIFAGFPGDIVDAGALRDSQTREEAGFLSYLFSWPVDYSLFVHEGYQLRNGKFQPPRPWTEYAVETFDPAARLQEIVTEKISKLPK